MGDSLFSIVLLIKENYNDKINSGSRGDFGGGGDRGERLLLDEEKELRYEIGRIDQRLLRTQPEKIRSIQHGPAEWMDWFRRPGSFSAVVRGWLSTGRINGKIES